MGNYYGLLAEFGSPEQIIKAARQTSQAGYIATDAFTPYPVHGLTQALGIKKTKLPLLVLLAGAVGFFLGYGLQYYVSVIAYPLNISGKPLNSIPSFIIVAFESAILLAGLTAVGGMLALNGFPRPSHPVFNVGRFKLASRDKFFLLVESRDPNFDLQKTSDFLIASGASEVIPVEP